MFKAPRTTFSCPAAEMAQLGTPRRERRAARSGVLPAPHAHPALEKVPNEIPVVFRGLALAWQGWDFGGGGGEGGNRLVYRSHHGEKAVWIRCKLPGDILVI